MDSFYKTQKLYKNHFPKVLLFDEFKSVKSIDGAMSFHLCDGTTGKTIDIVEDRKLLGLLKYFGKYSHKALIDVKYIVIDMYSPYISLIKKMFPNANIVIDNSHLIQLISRSLNKTRINIMKKDKRNYNKLKRYWKLLLKSKDELNYEKWKKFTCFNSFMTESDVVNHIINTNYHNGYIEENNNYIKVIKTILFGFRPFIRFKTRILICKGLLTIKKMANA